MTASSHGAASAAGRSGRGAAKPWRVKQPQPELKEPPSVEEVQQGLNALLQAFQATEDVDDQVASIPPAQRVWSRGVMLQAWYRWQAPRTPWPHGRKGAGRWGRGRGGRGAWRHTAELAGATAQGFSAWDYSAGYLCSPGGGFDQGEGGLQPLEAYWSTASGEAVWPAGDGSGAYAAELDGHYPVVVDPVQAYLAASGGGSEAPADLIKIREQQARHQVEYYFSPQNLCHDSFLRSRMDDDGWVSVQDIAEFPRVQRLGLDAGAVAASMLGSAVVEVSWDKPPRARLRSSEQRAAFPRVDLDEAAQGQDQAEAAQEGAGPAQ